MRSRGRRGDAVRQKTCAVEVGWRDVVRGKARVQSGLRRRRVSFETYVEKEGSGGRRARVRVSINGK